MTAALIKCDRLRVVYADKMILGPLNCSLPMRRKIAILGPNGAGKSTFLKAILGLLPYKGKMESRTGSMSYMAQRHEVDWKFPLTALDVTTMGLYRRIGWLRWVRQRHREKSLRALERVGMGDYAHRLIGALSVGQQQRVFLARSIVDEDAETFLFDEPFAGVDARTERVIHRIFDEIIAAGKSLLCVHHDLQSVSAHFDYGVLLNQRLISAGDLEKVLSAKFLTRAYKVPFKMMV